MNHRSTSHRRPDGHPFLSVGVLLLAAAVLLTAGLPAVAAPEGFDIRDADAFARCVDVSAKLEKLAGDMQFVEGPVWVPQDGGYLVFSDIPANELKKWTREGGVTSFRKPSGAVNGNAIDVSGRLVHCSHEHGAVLSTGKDGVVQTLVSAYEGKKLNSPNDLVIARSGAIYFTDPPYGMKGRQSEVGFRGVYRLEPESGKITALIKDITLPNGIALSPDEKTLYVAVSDAKTPVIRAYPLQADGSVGEGKELCRLDKGIPDGIRVDADGRIWSSAGDGVHIFAADGKLIGKILVPESPANLAFGGEDGRTLFITARKSLYAIRLKK